MSTDIIHVSNQWKGIYTAVDPVRCQSGEKIFRMVVYSIVRHHGPEVHDIGVVSVGKDSSLGDLERQQALRPKSGSMLCCPCLLPVSFQPMDEDDTAVKGGCLALTIPTVTIKRGVRLLHDRIF
jgi:hypothetical protein